MEDSYVWGSEAILWGNEPTDKYTVKLLKPNAGRFGCLSLQYHEKKDESWVVMNGQVWALLVINDTVCTKILKPGDFQNIPAKTIHRLMGLTRHVRVLEASSLDEHAADKNKEKDVVRLDCVFGRESKAHHDPKIVELCLEYTEEAAQCFIKEEDPPQYHPELFMRLNLLCIDN